MEFCDSGVDVYDLVWMFVILVRIFMIWRGCLQFLFGFLWFGIDVGDSGLDCYDLPWNVVILVLIFVNCSGLV